jgi:zinc D-Ala-D-Ala carboxypeptidase
MKHALVILLIVIAIAYMSRNKIIKTVFNEHLTTNFTLGELLVTSKPFPNIPNEREKENLRALAKKVLQPVRDLLSKVFGMSVPININSAFRSEQVNKAVGGVSNSQHRIGQAADIVPQGISLMEAFTIIAKSSIPYDQLIFETDEDGDQWIHISYNPNGGRKELLRAQWSTVKKKMVYSPLTV